MVGSLNGGVLNRFWWDGRNGPDSAQKWKMGLGTLKHLTPFGVSGDLTGDRSATGLAIRPLRWSVTQHGS